MSAACAGVMLFGTLVPIPLVAAGCTLFGVVLPLAFNWTFMSRKDLTEADQTRFENSMTLLSSQTDRGHDFTAALAKAVRKPKPSIEDIHAVMGTGEAYFQTLRLMAQAVLDGRVSEGTRDRDFVPKIAEALLKNIPLYYETLASQCAKFGIPFEGRFREGPYESLLVVVDRYDNATWQQVRPMLEGTP